MAFLQEAEPLRGIELAVIPGVHRVVAPNASVMTYYGTNTYLIDDGDAGITVLDPGPSNQSHIAAVVAAGRGLIHRIIVTHSHSDHYGGSDALREATGAPVYASEFASGEKFIVDHTLRDGEAIAGLTALHTPGHAIDHLCFERSDGVVFTADHVMGWASSIVNPPDGDMRDYCDSLEKMLTRPHVMYLCGHGPAIPDPLPHVRSLLNHRRSREDAIAATVARGAADPRSLMEQLYSKIDPVLKNAAERNVLAHLLKMQKEGKVQPRGTLWHWIAGTGI